MLGKKKQASLDIFLEVENMELQYELAFAATSHWSWSCWEGKWADDMCGAWKKQIFNASSLNKIRGPAGTVRCEFRDAGMQWPAWDSFAAENTLLDCRLIAPSDSEAFLIESAKVLRWMEKQTDEMEDGVWFLTCHNLLQGKM